MSEMTQEQLTESIAKGVALSVGPAIAAALEPFAKTITLEPLRTARSALEGKDNG